MHAPVLVTPPAILPVTLPEVKASLHVDFGDDDDWLTAEIKSATAHYDGWTGILCRCLVEQTWQQDFNHFQQCLPLPLGPVRSISSVKWRNELGQVATIAAEEYALMSDGGGRSHVRFRDGYSFPTDLYQVSAVSVDYVAGYPVNEGQSTVPEDIKAAIKLRVQLAYDQAASADGEYLERVERALMEKYRRTGLV